MQVDIAVDPLDGTTLVSQVLLLPSAFAAAWWERKPWKKFLCGHSLIL
jgi:fructose-1,6-bisphosphatase/sedoheptulose 1,7-bisphosphatase-like protein